MAIEMPLFAWGIWLAGACGLAFAVTCAAVHVLLGEAYAGPMMLLRLCLSGRLGCGQMAWAVALLWRELNLVQYITAMCTACPAALVWGLGPVHLLRALGQPKQARQSHGTADWGGVQHAIQRGYVVGRKQALGGFILGRVPLSFAERASYDDRYRVHGHVLTCAPTRSGKGVSGVIPNLLSYPGSTFCLDIKGELYAVTGERRCINQFEVARIDPFGLASSAAHPSHRVNWLEHIDVSQRNCISETAVLVDALVERNDAADSFWDDAAVSLLTGLILFVAAKAESEKHIGTVRQILMADAETFRAELLSMQEQACAFGVVARAANAFLAKSEKEASGVLSTAQRHTAFLDDPQIRDVVEAADFSFASLKTTKLSVYLIIPPAQMHANRRFVRVTLALALQAMTREPTQPDVPVAFFIDEMPQLGRLEALEHGVSLLQGYGVYLWLFVQDVSQLRAVYRKWESFLGNTTWQVFGTQDVGTARYMAEALGNRTIRIETESHSSSQGAQGQGSQGSSSHESYAARALMTGDEIRRLPRDTALVVQGGQKPMLLRKLDYRTDPEYRNTFRSNPMYKTDKPATKRKRQRVHSVRSVVRRKTRDHI
jgi:type IV secretion system protein VirD4